MLTDVHTYVVIVICVYNSADLYVETLFYIHIHTLISKELILHKDICTHACTYMHR